MDYMWQSYSFSNQNLPFFDSFNNNNGSFLPLWDINNLTRRTEDYYVQFEVVERESDDGDAIVGHADNLLYSEDNSKVEYVFCHLCNIEVPAPYIKEHFESSKHKTYKKIAEIGLERVKKQMENNYVAENPLPSTYFCPTCVILVPIASKSQHLKSKTHNNAVLLDKLLTDLLKIYSDDNLDVNNDVEIPEDDKNKTVDDPNLKDDDKLVVSKDTVKPDEDTVELTSEMYTKFNEYIRIINDASNSYTLEYIDGYYVKIKTDDNVHVKVKHQNYHGFVRLGKYHAQCKLCLVILKDMKAHMTHPDHLDKVMIPINKQGIRELGVSVNHCVICNDIIENPDTHVFCSKTHDRLLMDALLFENGKDNEVVNKTEQAKSKTVAYLLKDNDGNEPEGDKGSLNKYKTHIHQNKEDGEDQVLYSAVLKQLYKTINNKEEKNIVNMKEKDLDKHECNEKTCVYYILESVPNLNKVKCKVCSVMLSKETCDEHLLSRKHVYEHAKMLKENFLRKGPEKFTLICKICNVNLHIGDELDHIETTKHATLAEASTLSKSDKNHEENNYKELLGVVCQYDLQCNESGQRKNNVDKSGKRPNENLNVLNFKTDQTKKSKKSHKSDNPATIKKEHSFDRFIDPMMNENVVNIDSKNEIKEKKSDDISAGAKNLDLSGLESNLKTNKKTCKICNFSITNNPFNIIEHLKGPIHGCNMNTLKCNKIKVLDNMFSCELCSEDVPLGEQFAHITSRKHFINHSNAWSSCRVADNKDAQNSNYSNIKPLNFSQFGLSNIQRYSYFEMKASNNPSEVTCQVCSTKVQNHISILRTHVDGKKHSTLLNEMVTTNNIFFKKNHFFCVVCCIKLSTSDLFSHIKDERHLTALKMFACVITDNDFRVTKKEMNVKTHNEGLQHKNNIKFLEDNTLKMKGSVCYCETCDKSFSQDQIQEHISTARHLILKGADVAQ
ncbi:uncharacterized protein [Battus philenor]|uniref:uncharacterized protein n=1 Tax=Battus philenor TaxID=42288 RepID=UPI0035D093DB